MEQREKEVYNCDCCQLEFLEQDLNYVENEEGNQEAFLCAECLDKADENFEIMKQEEAEFYYELQMELK